MIAAAFASTLAIGLTAFFAAAQNHGVPLHSPIMAVPSDQQSPHWDRVVQRARFTFQENEANVLYSLSQYGGDCKIQIIYDPRRRGALQFKFLREGEEILVLEGHAHSVFRTADNVLYFARYHPWGSGCSVAAYDLTSGRELWQSTLKGVGSVKHSAYRNLVNMGMAGEAISIRGHESYGDYLEILDRKTGKRLAHRVFRKGFQAPEGEEEVPGAESG
jgi:hypothetical protein